MTDIYAQHDKAFAHVSAFVVTDAQGARVAKVVLQFSKSGLTTTAWFHLIGVQMVKASASGGGYDKASAAAAAAIDKIQPYDKGYAGQDFAEAINAHRVAFRLAASLMDNAGWSRRLEDAGYHVLQAV